MKYDGTLAVAFGHSAKSKTWKNEKIEWSEFAERLLTENKTKETYKQFMASNKGDQSSIKDVGGYVGGYLRQGRRKPENVVHRQIMTLDIDFAHLEFWDDFIMQFDNAAVLHGTHKHHEDTPRYRLVMPLSREVTPDEYVAISRQVAGLLGIELFDGTTFETNRLMFWPSTPSDQDYYAELQDGPWYDADEALASYHDWTDSSLWPTAGRDFDEVKSLSKKQEDPREKRWPIGPFCRTYSISEAIEAFLSDEYTEAFDERYTYLKGSTAAGVITYEDLFAFSHHGTDPISGKLCNAFDLVRIHKFGHLDGDSESNAKSNKSFRAMEEFIQKDAKTKKTVASETVTEAKYAFVDEDEEEDEEAAPKGLDLDWMQEMDTDPKGKYLASASNINIILANDYQLKNRFKQNNFDGQRYICKKAPWRKVSGEEPMKNVDYAGVRNYIESIYGIAGNLKIDDSLALEFEKQSFHPVKDYLEATEWDGEARLDTVLIDYLGAEDNIYTREAIRKMLCGAVARILNPGVKFDLVLTLVGKQGTGKSTIIKILGREWFSDTFMGVSGKEALEQIQGAWLIEMAELAGLRKAEVEAVKHFITKQEDTFRPAYARTAETYKRQCVFFGTTNNPAFLRDPSGNRRFMPVDIDQQPRSKSVWDDLEANTAQIWAEAVAMYKGGEKLYLGEAAEAIARTEQLNHSEADDRQGVVENYLERLLPKNWAKLDLYERRDWLASDEKGAELRVHTCVAEVWCECLGKEKEDMSRYNTRDINEILRGLQTWDAGRSPRNFPLYGKQKYYSLIK